MVLRDDDDAASSLRHLWPHPPTSPTNVSDSAEGRGILGSLPCQKTTPIFMNARCPRTTLFYSIEACHFRHDIIKLYENHLSQAKLFIVRELEICITIVCFRFFLLLSKFGLFRTILNMLLRLKNLLHFQPRATHISSFTYFVQFRRVCCYRVVTILGYLSFGRRYFFV